MYKRFKSESPFSLCTLKLLVPIYFLGYFALIVGRERDGIIAEDSRAKLYFEVHVCDDLVDVNLKVLINVTMQLSDSKNMRGVCCDRC